MSDKYHYIRQVIWSFEHTRKQEQQKFFEEYRIYFKCSKSLLTKKYKYLTEEQKIQVNNMINTSYTLMKPML
ncbi:transposase [uncultured Tyzzerella sp.]|uniref:transposase n=1 Tax=uncultured Tyzzerella sp. TaxID=2321398 RepID=UPI002942FDF5|nr:transposase [uncultured Tyzzerella sp.]